MIFNIKIQISRNKYFNENIVNIKYNKKNNKYTILINKICLKNEKFFNKIALSIIVNEIKTIKNIKKINSNKIDLLLQTKKSLILKKINSKYLDYDVNFIKSLIDEKDLLFDDKHLNEYKIDVLFKKIYTKYEIRELLKNYPVLALEFENDGEEKNIISLIYDRYKLKLTIKRNNINSKEMYKLKTDLNVYEHLLTKKTYLDIKQINNDYIEKIIEEIKETLQFDYKNDELNKEKTKIIQIIVNKYLLQLKNNNLITYYEKIFNTFDKKICNIK